MSYAKNNKIDSIYVRYLTSFDKTKETRLQTGTKVYDFYLDFLQKEMNKDLLKVIKDEKRYLHFLIKKWKYDKKVDKLMYKTSGDEIYINGFFGVKSYCLFKGKGLRYRKRKDFKIYRLKKWFKNVLRKYSDVIPKDELSNYEIKLNI